MSKNVQRNVQTIVVVYGGFNVEQDFVNLFKTMLN